MRPELFLCSLMLRNGPKVHSVFSYKYDLAIQLPCGITLNPRVSNIYPWKNPQHATYLTGIHLDFLWHGGKWRHDLVCVWGSCWQPPRPLCVGWCRSPKECLFSHLKNLIWMPLFPQVAVHSVHEDHFKTGRKNEEQISKRRRKW